MADLAQDYQQAGFGRRLGWGRCPAVLCIDICRAYLDHDSPLYAGVEAAVASAGRIVAAARRSGVPVLHTRVQYAAGGADGGMFYRKVAALACFDEGSPLGEFCVQTAPDVGEVVVTKQYASAFFATPLAATLTAIGIDTLVITGLSTSGCVRASAVDAIQHGFRPLVVREACGDRDGRPHDAALFDIDAKYGDVVSEAEVLARFQDREPA